MKKETRNNLILILTSLLISILLLEGGLRIFINYRHRYFISEDRNGVQYFKSNPNCWSILHGQSFLRNKPDKTYRIFTFGESTTEGSIYQGKVSFIKFLEWKLKNLLPSEHIEVINFGKAGESSMHVLEKVKTALKYDPDLFIIYAGHNEFIRFDDEVLRNNFFFNILDRSYLYTKLFKRVVGLFYNQTSPYLQDARSFEDKPVCGDDEFHEVQEEYRRNIASIVEIARDSNVDIILSNIVGNYQGWEPNRSVHKKGLNEKELQEWRYHCSRGKEYQEKGESGLAIREFELAKKIDPDFAELNFRLARSYERVARFQEAKREYYNAADNDGDPKIASSLFKKFIEETCQRNQIPYVDAIGAFERVSENSLIGYNIMVDAHHPSMLGELIIAKEIIKVMAESNIPVPSEKWSFEKDMPDEWYLAKPNLSHDDEILYHQNRGLWFAKLSTRIYAPESRLERARYHFEKARELDQDSFRTYIGFSIIDLLERNKEQAIIEIQKACKINTSDTIDVLFKDPWISNLFLNNQILLEKNCTIES